MNTMKHFDLCSTFNCMLIHAEAPDPTLETGHQLKKGGMRY